MDEPHPPALPESSTPATTSLVSRLTNVFAAPGEVFDEVKAAEPSVANWMVPVVLMLVLAVAATFLIYSSQPSNSRYWKCRGRHLINKSRKAK